MNKSLRNLLIAGLLVAALFSIPLWIPELLAKNAIAPEALGNSENPVSETDPIILLDAGWITGNNTQRVLAVPQVMAWDVGQAEALWATETGFLFGAISDPENQLIYVTEQRSVEKESLLDMTFEADVLYQPNNRIWEVYLTTINQQTGEVVDRQSLADLPVHTYEGADLYPIGLDGKMLYLMNYAAKNNLFAYDLKTHQFGTETWSMCEKGYAMKVVFDEEFTSVIALCANYETAPQSGVTVTKLNSGEQRSLELAPLGEEDYQTGNGLVLGPANTVYVVDTDAGAFAKLDLQTTQIVQTVNYGDTLQESSLGQRLLTWLIEMGAHPAHAKRWMAVSALSPDGRWLAVDGGIGLNSGVNVSLILIDLQTLQGSQKVELNGTPSQMLFSDNGSLPVFFEKSSMASPLAGIVYDLASETQTSFRIPMHGWLRGVVANR